MNMKLTVVWLSEILFVRFFLSPSPTGYIKKDKSSFDMSESELDR